MSRGKKKESFQHNPFRNLKGLSVSPSSRLPTEQAEENTKAPPLERSGDDDAAFADEMARLGVERRTVSEIDPAVEEERPEEIVAEPEVSDEALFLAALDGMDARFEDGLPEAVEPSAAPRRMKQLRQGRLTPEDRIDLHGLSRAEVRQRVGYFLDNAAYHGRKTVLIITGRGRGSGGEPVLRTEVERFLADEGRKWISEWGRAPRRYGGEGALVVFLKSAVKD